MDSLQALGHFTNHWRDRPSFLVDPFGNSTFRAQVDYETPQLRNRLSTIVRIRQHGNGKGKISVHKEPTQAAALPHVEFFLPQHAYDYDADNHALLVHGHSDQLGGSYRVIILPA